jgi:arginyl-tRNA synthetase
MTLCAVFHDRVAAILSHIVSQRRLPADLDTARFTVEPPRDPVHGDLTINAALVYARESEGFFVNPRQLASEIAAALAADPDVAQAEVAGPGFVNLRLAPAVFCAMLRASLLADASRHGHLHGVPSGDALDHLTIAEGRHAIVAEALIALRAACGRANRTIIVEGQLSKRVELTRGGRSVQEQDLSMGALLSEVGADALRFAILSCRSDAPLDFDIVTITEHSKDNPMFWTQYAHARTKTVQRQALAAFPDIDARSVSLADGPLALLSDEGEWRLIKQIAQYASVIEAAAEAQEPQRLALYLHDLASSFHAHWTRAGSRPQLRFVNEESRELTCARLAMVSAIGGVIRAGLQILGVSAPMEMR